MSERMSKIKRDMLREINATLSPCKHCGSTAIDFWTNGGWWAVGCTVCHVMTGEDRTNKLADAVAVWNRTPDAASAGKGDE